MELNLIARTEEMATLWQCNPWKTKTLNSQATEQASLLTVALQHSVQVLAVLTCFYASFASLDDTKCC
jgi:hypothetical protein